MASLLVASGEFEGQYFPIPDEPIVSVGRDDACTIQIRDPRISRKHLQIRVDRHTGLRVGDDYRSANGVEINEKRIVEAHPLKNGDEIRIGDTMLVYLEQDHPDAQAAEADYKKTKEWKRTTMS